MRSLLVCAVVVSGLAQEPARVGVGAVQRRLTLQEAVERALKNNLEIELERTSVVSAHNLLHAARGAYDGMFRWQPGYERRDTPTSSVLFGANGKLAERFHNQNFSYQQRLRWNGASFHAGFDNSRQSTTNPFVSLNPFTQSRLVLGFTQPLMRNRLIDRERSDIAIRSKNIGVSRIDLELRAVDVAARAELAYWDLVAAREDVVVKADGVTWGREQLARSRRMIDSGTLAPVELAAAEAELERRIDSYHASVGVVTEVENALKTLIASGKDDEIWNEAIIPTERRDPAPPGAEELQRAVAVAMEKRLEFRRLGLQGEANQVRKQAAADRLKPQVDLVGAWVNAGLAGTEPAGAGNNLFAQSNAITLQRINELSARAGLAPVTVPSFGGTPPGLVGGYGSVLSGVFGLNYQTFQVGLSVDWNVRNHAAEAEVSEAVVTERRLKLQRAQLEQGIAAQVRNALQAIETARQRIAAAEASARAAKEKLDSETRLFQNGESTNFFVLTRQNEYTDSARRIVVSRLELNKAIARLRLAMGETLESHRISVAP